MPRATEPLIVHLFCAAHIDPVWMWPWEEGAREAISTFRTAADLLDEFPEFIFNHNESLLYEWVAEYDQPLFQRIRDHVRAGRWNITGGWYLQPDVNLPGGESLVRCILEGRRYFADEFVVRPPVAYNFDSFGHPGSLPQLLNQSGFEFYIHCRPVESQMALPAPLYRWRGMDGSEVMTLRPDAGWYGTPNPGQAQAQARKGIDIARATGRDVLVTWGLGDHGGGATRHDLLLFREMIAETEGSTIQLRHSTPEAYLARIKTQVKQLPVQRGELQRTLSGTYTSVAPIKRAMREGEALLASAERWAALAWWRSGWPYPADELRNAWKRLLFTTFHDVLCGSLTEDAIPGVMDMYGYTRDVARRVIVRSQHAALPAIVPTPDTIPLYVLNPHSTPLKAFVGCHFLIAYAPLPKMKSFALYDDKGRRVPSQTGGGTAVLSDGTWQPHVGFVADVPPLSARRYEIRVDRKPANARLPLFVSEDATGITVENSWWRARFDRASAALVELKHQETGRVLLNAPVRLFAMADVGHAWGGENRAAYNEPVSPLLALSPEAVGGFTGMEGHSGPALRVIASGSVYTTVECLVGWQHTRAALQITFYADLPHIDINSRLYMQARRKMIKLALPFTLTGLKAVCEVPYGVAERPADATEYPYARWIRLETADMSVGVANSGQSGFDVSADGLLHLSLTRGAVHSSWEGDPGTKPPDLDRSYTYMDQVQIDTRFRIVAGAEVEALTAALILAALELNQPLERFFAYHAPATPEGASSVPFLDVRPATVVLGALKKAEDGDALIVRLVETGGKRVTARVCLDGGPEQRFRFTPHQIRTFRVTRQSSGILWQECNLLEELL